MLKNILLKMINEVNNTFPLYPTGYIEKVCSDYLIGFNNLVLKIIILNILYFMFLKHLVSKIKPIGNEKFFIINFSLILETIVIMGNITLGLYYLIFNYNIFIFNNLNTIKWIVIIIIILIVLYYLIFNWKRLIKFIKEYKPEDENKKE